jgi:hypothetical protein
LTNVIVSDAVPAGLSSFVWSGNGHNNVYDPIIDAITSLAPCASVVYTVTAAADPVATGTLSNTITVTAADDTNPCQQYRYGLAHTPLLVAVGLSSHGRCRSALQIRETRKALRSTVVPIRVTVPLSLPVTIVKPNVVPPQARCRGCGEGDHQDRWGDIADADPADRLVHVLISGPGLPAR